MPSVHHISVQSKFVYIYTGLRVLMIWAIYLFPCNMFFLLRKVVDVTTISRLQSLTSVKIVDCTLRVPEKTATIFRMSNNKNNLYSLKSNLHSCIYIFIVHSLSSCIYQCFYFNLLSYYLIWLSFFLGFLLLLAPWRQFVCLFVCWIQNSKN